ncbi:MAG: transcriptional regulator [Acidimicrobiales bacterium]|nr:transcriptional regulator [Acidimicrobiales bacterium]
MGVSAVANDQRTARRDHERGVLTRRALLDSALHVFAASGFEAASTRTIAAGAGVRQSQLTYHFDSKDVLWRAAVDHLFGRFDHELIAAIEPGPDDPASLFARSIRALVRAVSRLPELNRIMVHEATGDSERLAWIVESHVRARFEQLETLWRALRASGATTLDAEPVIIYYTILGAASLLYVNAAEARRLVRSDPSHDVIDDALIEAHADTLVAMLLGPSRPSARARTVKRG